MFKPKNHMASHFPLDILTHGPVRHYWCMRFEALNQLFKSFASHGAFRDTCGRCAAFWSMHIARARFVAATSSTSTTVKVIRAKQPRKYEKGLLAMSDLSEDSGGVTVVEGILGILQKTSVRIEWISRLQYGSAEIFAGQTWLSATLNGDSILAFLPEHGVFRIQDRIFFLLRIFPLATLDSFGMPCTAIPKSFTPQERLVKVDYPGMRGARGVKTRSSGLVPLVAGGMYTFCVVRTFVVMLLQLCVRLCWPWLQDVVVHVHVFVVVHGHVSRAAVPIPV